VADFQKNLIKQAEFEFETTTLSPDEILSFECDI